MILTTMETFDTLITIALDLTAALSAGDRYRRLLEALGAVIPYDAASLLRLEGEELAPVAARGLSPDALGRRYAISEHPRLARICKAHEPVRFPADDPSPDPFDGMILGDLTATKRIHACLGCPLYVDGELLGALTADALNPKAFEALDQEFLRAVTALAAAQMRTADLMKALEASAERQGMIARNLMEDMHQGKEIIGRSRAMEHLLREIDLVSGSDFTVLVTGETGVGKELVARAIHAASLRRSAPLLYLNCATLPESLAESELFGHSKGAFTGAVRDRPGKFEVADGGTLFLDEIGELPLSIQPKLLRVIQEGELQRIGSVRTLRVNVRLLAATNRNLEEEVQAGRFRADLFHRLSVYPISVPPLRERREDIALLAGHFSEVTQRRLGLGPVRLNSGAFDLLRRAHWPGNVRELENALSRAILKASSGVPRGNPVIVTPIHLDGDGSAALQTRWPGAGEGAPLVSQGASFREQVEDFQKDIILRSVARNNGNWAAAARDLGMHRSNLHNLASRLGIRGPGLHSKS
jgi:anaerobic nitric oxide reductase transcription regulator